MNNITYNIDEYQTLKTLAAKCPDISGVAVYKARMLLSLVETVPFPYPDNCNTATAERNTEDENLSKSLSAAYKLYPNPTRQGFTLEYTIEAGAQVRILNTLGVMMAEYELPVNETALYIPTDNLPAGMYFVQVANSNANVFSQKLIINR